MKTIKPTTNDKIGEVIADFVTKLEDELPLVFHGFDVSYVDTKERRLETCSYSTEAYSTITSEGIREKPGSMLRSPVEYLAQCQILKLADCDHSESSYINRPVRDYSSSDISGFEIEDHSAKPENWVNYYVSNEYRGHFAVGGVEDSEFSYRLVLFALYETYKPVSEALISEKLNAFVQEKIRGVVFEKFRRMIKAQKVEAFRAAISEIMNRNKAHHLGSHISRNATNAKVKERIVDLYKNCF